VSFYNNITRRIIMKNKFSNSSAQIEEEEEKTERERVVYKK